MTYQSALLVLGNQLFPIEEVTAAQVDCVVMIEDPFLCRHFAYHQHKLVLVLAAMRSYAQSLRQAGINVLYQPLDVEQRSATAEQFMTTVRQLLAEHEVAELVHFEVEGKADEFGELGATHGYRPQSATVADVSLWQRGFRGISQGPRQATNGLIL